MLTMIHRVTLDHRWNAYFPFVIQVFQCVNINSVIHQTVRLSAAGFSEWLFTLASNNVIHKATGIRSRLCLVQFLWYGKNPLIFKPWMEEWSLQSVTVGGRQSSGFVNRAVKGFFFPSTGIVPKLGLLLIAAWWIALLNLGSWWYIVD